MTRVSPSDPRYPAIVLMLQELAIALNPACWFGVDIPAPERAYAIIEAENILEDLLEDARLAVFEDYVDEFID